MDPVRLAWIGDERRSNGQLTCPQLAERAVTTLTFRRGWATPNFGIHRPDSHPGGPTRRIGASYQLLCINKSIHPPNGHLYDLPVIGSFGVFERGTGLAGALASPQHNTRTQKWLQLQLQS